MDSIGNIWTNCLRAVIAAWLIFSKISRIGAGVKKSVGVKLNADWVDQATGTAPVQHHCRTCLYVGNKPTQMCWYKTSRIRYDFTFEAEL